MSGYVAGRSGPLNQLVRAEYTPRPEARNAKEDAYFVAEVHAKRIKNREDSYQGLADRGAQHLIRSNWQQRNWPGRRGDSAVKYHKKNKKGERYAAIPSPTLAASEAHEKCNEDDEHS